MTTWEECHAAGMTASEAAKALGKAARSAYHWATKRGLQWATLSPEEHAQLIRQGMQTSPKMTGRKQAIRPQPGVNGMGERRNPAKALPPEQERHGGAFWMVNSKTGERVTKATSTGIYREAQLRGWVDWEWGPVT